jgi:hypothetical protein
VAKTINECPSINEDFCSRSRHAKKITTPLKYRDKPAYVGYSEDYFLSITQIGQKDHLWMDTSGYNGLPPGHL